MKCEKTEVELEIIINRIMRNDINLQPDFQRGEVWKTNKQVKLIDTILRGWMIPPIHCICGEDAIDEVLDGQQRLVAIRDFYNNKFCVDGNIAPVDEAISKLDKLYFNQLPLFYKRRFLQYGIILIRLTDFKASEPAELFYRLNQPVNLTAAEQRNAYAGKPRNQIKSLVQCFVNGGANSELVGFSNTRLAYDEVISKFAFIIESNTIRKKVTALDISKKYMDNVPFSDITINSVKFILKKLIDSLRENTNKGLKNVRLSKATLLSWLLFVHKHRDINIPLLAEFILVFEKLRNKFKNKTGILDFGLLDTHINRIIKDYPDTELLLSIYNQRASMGSTDALSIIYRDIIMEIVYDIYRNNNSEIIRLICDMHNNGVAVNEMLDKINTTYIWGDSLIAKSKI